jgi:hypothetical protein
VGVKALAENTEKGCGRKRVFSLRTFFMNFSMGKALLSHFNFLVIRVMITGMNIIATTICADARCFNYVHDVVCFRVTLHVAGTLDDQHGTDYDY